MTWPAVGSSWPARFRRSPSPEVGTLEGKSKRDSRATSRWLRLDGRRPKEGWPRETAVGGGATPWQRCAGEVGKEGLGLGASG